MKAHPLQRFTTALVEPPPARPRPVLVRYGLALATVGAAFLLGVTFPTILGDSVYLLMITAVLVTGWYGGIGPGLLAAALSVLPLGYIFFGSPRPVWTPGIKSLVRLGAATMVTVVAGSAAIASRRSARLMREQWGMCRVTLTSIGDAVIVTDSRARVTFMNAVAQHLTGWSLVDAFGRPLTEVFRIVNEMSRDLVENPVNRVVREGVVVGLANHTVLIARDGIERPIDDSGAPIRERGGQVIGVVLVFRDVTERKEAERQQQELLGREQAARAIAEAANRTKDEFLATLSHELRTPLTAVLGWARLLRTFPLDPARTAQALETIERNAMAQARLVDDLLDVSRVITGRLQLDVRPVDLISVVDAVLQAVRPAAEAKHLRLRTRLDPGAGPVLGDAARLQQVAWNLVSNAVKFTPKEGVVEVILERADSSVQIVVRDTGPGIAPEFLPHVFDRFTQADMSVTRRHGGLGLGLAIVRHLVELHGGKVQAQSGGPGQGAEFTVTLPLRPVSEATTGQPELFPPAPGGPPSLAGVRVLVVEDDADGRDLLTVALGSAGATVHATVSVAEAIEVLQGEPIDLVVSDIGLAGEDGYALIRRLRALPPEQGGRLPAVALTGYATAADRARVLEAGFQEHVTKPVAPDTLAAVIARLVGRARPA